MPALHCHSKSCLIPKELFKEDNISELGNLFFTNTNFENVEKENLDDFFLIYPHPTVQSSVFPNSNIIEEIRENLSFIEHAVCLNVYEKEFFILALKKNQILFSGSFSFSVNEDIAYQLANIMQQFYDDLSQPLIYYQTIDRKILQFLLKYFEIKKL